MLWLLEDLGALRKTATETGHLKALKGTLLPQGLSGVASHSALHPPTPSCSHTKQEHKRAPLHGHIRNETREAEGGCWKRLSAF